jgi:hypothetical protein
VSGIYGVTMSTRRPRNGTLAYLFGTAANRFFLFVGAPLCTSSTACWVWWWV